MGEAAGVEGHHAGVDVVAAEEVAGVVEDHLVVVVVVVEERHLQGARIGFERARREGADDEPVGEEGRVGRGRQVVAVAHQRPQVAHVDPHHRQLAVPAHRVERVERIGDQRHGVAPLHLDLPLGLVRLLREELGVDARRVEHRGVEDRVVAHEALVRQLVASVGGLDHQQVEWCSGLDPPHRAARQHEVVACLDGEPPEVAVELAHACVHEEQFVAVGVARESRHAAGQAPVADTAVRVDEHLVGRPGARGPRGELGEVEGPRLQRSGEPRPAGGRVAVVEERGGPEEALLAHLALVRALGQIAVRLTRGGPFDA